jgi:hypothetical protein
MEQEVRFNTVYSELHVKFGISEIGNPFTIISVGHWNAAACAIGLIVDSKILLERYFALCNPIAHVYLSLRC